MHPMDLLFSPTRLLFLETPTCVLSYLLLSSSPLGLDGFIQALFCDSSFQQIPVGFNLPEKP